MDARLQYGPFDGTSGHIAPPAPGALDVRRCDGCGCGRPLHYLPFTVADPTVKGYVRYNLKRIDDRGALYRYAETLDPTDAVSAAKAATV